MIILLHGKPNLHRQPGSWDQRGLRKNLATACYSSGSIAIQASKHPSNQPTNQARLHKLITQPMRRTMQLFDSQVMPHKGSHIFKRTMSHQQYVGLWLYVVMNAKLLMSVKVIGWKHLLLTNFTFLSDPFVNHYSSSNSVRTLLIDLGLPGCGLTWANSRCLIIRLSLMNHY